MQHILTIVVDDTNADEDTCPLETAVSNLQYDNYRIILANIDSEQDMDFDF